MKFSENSTLSHVAEIWVLRGIVNHSHAEDDLRAVVKRHKIINKVPKGYNYPELLGRKQLSQEMQEMLKRKVQHENHKDNE